MINTKPESERHAFVLLIWRLLLFGDRRVSLLQPHPAQWLSFPNGFASFTIVARLLSTNQHCAKLLMTLRQTGNPSLSHLNICLNVNNAPFLLISAN